MDIGKTTIRELYEKALADGTENYIINIQYQDNGGWYNEFCEMSDIEYNHDTKRAKLG